MMSRKAIISALVLGLMLCLCLLCLPWASLWACVTPDSYPPPLFIFRKWLRNRNILKITRDCISISGEGVVPHIPLLTQAAPAKAALVIDCLGHFRDCFSWSYLHSPFTSFTPHPPTHAFELHPSRLLGAPFCQTLPSVLKRDFLSLIP